MTRAQEVLVAGAGTGKTYALVTRVLARLEGVDPRGATEPVPPRGIVVVTFTNKAAAELSQRIQQRVEALAAGASDEALTSLATQATQAGDRPRQDTAFWATTVAPHLGEMFVGTFHGFGQWILRTYAVEAGLEAEFALMSPDDGQKLLRTAVETAVLERLDAGETAVLRLLARVPVDALVRALADVRNRLANEGRGPGAEAPATPVDNVDPEALAVEALRGIGHQLIDAVEGLLAVQPASLKSAKRATEVIEQLGASWRDGTKVAIEAAIEAPDCWTAPATVLALARLEHDKPSARAKAIKEQATALKEALDAVGHAIDAREVGGLYGSLVRLLAAIEGAYDAAKARRGAVDHDDLLLKARDLLRLPRVRAAMKARIAVVMVDEFQDTNLVQLETITLLSERKADCVVLEPSEAAVPTPRGRIELEPGMLVLVGDPRQAIYEFRGADVDVFRAAIELLTDEPTALVVNRRSLGSILALANAVASTALEDREPLVPHRSGDGVVEVLDAGAEADAKADAYAFAAARAIAGRVRALVSSGTRPTDIAVLARGAATLGPIQRALEAQKIAAVIAGGSGFYRAQEVADIVAFASLLIDPSDDWSLVSVLRSPFASVSDATLLRLKAVGPNIAESFEQRAFDGLDEQADLLSLHAIVSGLGGEIERIGLSTALRRAVDETGYATTIAGDTLGESRVANLERLFAIIDEMESTATSASPASIVRSLRQRIADGAKEAPAVVEPAVGAVRLMTVHASKGLEFEVVVLAGLASPPPPDASKLRYHRSVGLLLADDKTHAVEGLETLKRRRAAEELRLLYVAITRARDRLILSGLERTRKGNWADAIQTALDAAPDLASRIDTVAPPRSSRAPALVAIGSGPASVRAHAASVRERPASRMGLIRFDAAILARSMECSRRAYLTETLGIEDPLAESTHVRAPGRAVLNALTTVAESGPLFARRSIDSAIDALLIDASRAVAAETLARLADTRFGRRLLSCRVEVDVPYVVALAPDVVLTGQIDLLAVTPDEHAWAVAVARHDRGAARHRARLDAVAARALMPEARGAQAAVIGLLDPRPLAAERLDAAALGAVVDAARAAAGDRHVMRSVEDWPGEPVEVCRSLGCAFIERCHRLVSPGSDR